MKTNIYRDVIGYVLVAIYSDTEKLFITIIFTLYLIKLGAIS